MGTQLNQEVLVDVMEEYLVKEKVQVNAIEKWVTELKGQMIGMEEEVVGIQTKMVEAQERKARFHFSEAAKAVEQCQERQTLGWAGLVQRRGWLGQTLARASWEDRLKEKPEVNFHLAHCEGWTMADFSLHQSGFLEDHTAPSRSTTECPQTPWK